jgi:hypothetical protein
MIYNIINRSRSNLPKASEVLNCYLKQENYPHWTAFFVKYKDVINDQFFLSTFINVTENNSSYLILRTGCFPFIKYHCSKIEKKDHIDPESLKLQNNFFNIIKVTNFGIVFLFFFNEVFLF